LGFRVRLGLIDYTQGTAVGQTYASKVYTQQHLLSKFTKVLSPPANVAC